MTCLPIAGFGKTTKKPKWVECTDNKRMSSVKKIHAHSHYGPRPALQAAQKRAPGADAMF
jgi:hypothetical protein